MAGAVPIGPLITFYNNTEEGQIADPKAFDDAIQAIVATINENYAALIATVNGASGAHLIGSSSIPGVTGNTVFTQIQWIEQQVLALQTGVVPPGTVTSTMLQDGSVTFAKHEPGGKAAIAAGKIIAHSTLGGL